jgi:hypothetical protein
VTCSCSCHVGGPYRPPCDVPGGCGPHTESERRCHAGRCARMAPGLCDACARLCGQWLSEIPGLVQLLAVDVPGPCCDKHSAVPLSAGAVRTATGPRVSGTGETPLPGGVDRLSWLGRAATVHDVEWIDRADADRQGDVDCQTGAVPIAAALASWAVLVAEEFSVHVPTVGRVVAGPHGPVRRTAADDVARLERFLAIWHDKIVHEPWSDEFAMSVHEQWSRARAMAGVGEPLHRLGACPTEGEDGKPCGATLWAEPQADRITCRRCRSEWPRSRWLWLGGLLRETG